MNYVFDIDGTLADCSHRLHFIKPPAGTIHFNLKDVDWKPDWDSFHNSCDQDEPIKPVLKLLHDLLPCVDNITFLTGRPEQSRDKTIEWFAENAKLDVGWRDLFMRKDGDHREDYVVKRELLERMGLDKSKTIIFDDRDQVVQVLRSDGWTVFQVKNGSY